MRHGRGYSGTLLGMGEEAAPNFSVKALISGSCALLLGQSHQLAASCKESVKNGTGNENLRDASCISIMAANGKLIWEVIS